MVYPVFFDADWYRDVYPDVAASGMAPLRHYLRYGRAEGRRPCPLMAADRERDILLGLAPLSALEALCDAPEAAERVWARLALARLLLRGIAPVRPAAPGRPPQTACRVPPETTRAGDAPARTEQTGTPRPEISRSEALRTGTPVAADAPAAGQPADAHRSLPGAAAEDVSGEGPGAAAPVPGAGAPGGQARTAEMPDGTAMTRMGEVLTGDISAGEVPTGEVQTTSVQTGTVETVDASERAAWEQAAALLAPLTFDELTGFALPGPVLLAAEVALVSKDPGRAQALLTGARRRFRAGPVEGLRHWRQGKPLSGADLALAQANLMTSPELGPQTRSGTSPLARLVARFPGSDAAWRWRLLLPFLRAGLLPPRLSATRIAAGRAAPSASGPGEADLSKADQGEAGSDKAVLNRAVLNKAGPDKADQDKAGTGPAPAAACGPPARFDRLAAPFVWPRRRGPLVSVLMPARNAAAFIGTALSGLCAQSWRTLEILVLDNGSADETASLVTDLARRDPRIRLIDAAEQPGAYGARNLGLSLAEGDFITTHDADDWSHPARIARQVGALQANPAWMACLTHWLRATPGLRFTFWWGGDGLCHPNISSLMMRREVADTLGGWDLLRAGADSEYPARIRAWYGAEAVGEVLPGVPLSFGRQTPGSLSRASATSVLSLWRGPRRDYHQAAAAWHRETRAAGGSLCLPLVPSRRPFPAPAVLLPPGLRGCPGDQPPAGARSPADQAPGLKTPELTTRPPETQDWPAGDRQKPEGQAGFARRPDRPARARQAGDGLPEGGQARAWEARDLQIRDLQTRDLQAPEGRARSRQAGDPQPDDLLPGDPQPGAWSPGAWSPGDWQRLRASPLFDADWQLVAQPHLRLTGADPAAAFLAAGAAAGEDPGPSFSTSGYALSLGLTARDLPLSQLLARLADPAPCLPDLAGDLPETGAPRVLIFGHRAAEAVFGAERSLLDMLDRVRRAGLVPLAALPAAGNAGYRAAVLARCHRLYIRPIPWRYGGIAPPAATVGRLTALIRASRAAEVHVNTLVSEAPLLAAAQAGVPAALWVRELPGADPQLSRDLGLRPAALRDEIVRASRAAPAGLRLIANSDRVAAWLRQGGAGAVTVLPNPVDPALFDLPPPAAAAGAAGQAGPGAGPAGRLRLGLIGSLTRRKGLFEVVALARVLPQMDVVLVGPDSEDLTALRSAGQLPVNLHHAGYRATPAGAVGLTDVVLSLSRMQESYGRSLVEAMAAGRPVLCWDHGTPPDLVGRDGTAGFVLPAGDLPAARAALLSLLRPGVMAALSAGARARARELARRSQAVPDPELFPAALSGGGRA